MTNYNTQRNTPATRDALREAYIAGARKGIMIGAVMAMTPTEKTVNAYRAAQVAKRMADMAETHRKHRPSPPRRFWPAIMPGGWPLPPTIPTDDPDDWWPEDDGWPCPPPSLRGEA